jgi:hypothetical protein
VEDRAALIPLIELQQILSAKLVHRESAVLMAHKLAGHGRVKTRQLLDG